MCGICALLNASSLQTGNFLHHCKILNHRGPDFCGLAHCNYTDTNGKTAYHMLGHTRLAIVSPNSGMQPIYNPTTDSLLAVNGEIYNYKQILAEHSNISPVTGSDCEAIMIMFNNFTQMTSHEIITKLNKLRGMFAFILIDKKTGAFLIARDPIGIIPLYYAFGHNGLWVASELKVIKNYYYGDIFSPGHYLYYNPTNSKATNDNGSLNIVPYYQARIDNGWKLHNCKLSYDKTKQILLQKLQGAVRSHLMTDVPFGCLLSGGLDSSIIASMVGHIIDKDTTLHTFSVGLVGSPDLKAAREMVTYLEQFCTVKHHEINFTVQQAIDLLYIVIYHLETFDCTTIRASTPMIILAMYIKSINIKMVLSGEGADELFGGYLHFKQAPNSLELGQECERLMLNLHRKDCLRANKSTMAAGVELRVPFLDTDVVDFVMSINPEYKMCSDKIEKQLLRETCKDLLPESIYARQKEQFSDGVGYNWVDSIKEYAEQKYPHFNIDEACNIYPIKTPRTAEEFLYRNIFNEIFEPNEMTMMNWINNTVSWEKSISCSSEKALQWSKEWQNRADPSGRSLDHHNSS